jgi:hypothetical protein
MRATHKAAPKQTLEVNMPHGYEKLKRIQEDMYRDMVLCGDVTQLAMLGDKCIGAIGCRLQMKEDGKAKIYILTLGVLTPYQNAGIGTRHLLLGIAYVLNQSSQAVWLGLDSKISDVFSLMHPINGDPGGRILSNAIGFRLAPRHLFLSPACTVILTHTPVLL